MSVWIDLLLEMSDREGHLIRLYESVYVSILCVSHSLYVEFLISVLTESNQN